MKLYYHNAHVKGLIFHPKHLWLHSEEESSNVPTWIQILKQGKADLGNAPLPPLQPRAAGAGELVGCSGCLQSEAALCCSQQLGINITERVRAELFPQSVHIMDVNVKMLPSEV